ALDRSAGLRREPPGRNVVTKHLREERRWVRIVQGRADDRDLDPGPRVAHRRPDVGDDRGLYVDPERRERCVHYVDDREATVVSRLDRHAHRDLTRQGTPSAGWRR